MTGDDRERREYERLEAEAAYDRHLTEAVSLLDEAKRARPIGEEQASDRHRSLVATAQVHATLAQAAATRAAKEPHRGVGGGGTQ